MVVASLILLLQHNVEVITGGPCVDKTTQLISILKIFSVKYLNIRLCALKGRAAKRLSESTGL